MVGSQLLEHIGARALETAHAVGGIGMLGARVLRALAPPSFDRTELLRSLYKMGNLSVPILMLTAFFTGGIMVIQSGLFVRRFNATGLVTVLAST